jgi:hypothetical protein
MRLLTVSGPALAENWRYDLPHRDEPPPRHYRTHLHHGRSFLALAAGLAAVAAPGGLCHRPPGPTGVLSPDHHAADQRTGVPAGDAVAQMKPPPRPVRFVIAALAAAPVLPTAASADDAKAPPAPAVRCEEAVVSPVSGYAECVKPRGAAVDPPPPRPPPSPEVCARHPELSVEDCRPPRPPETP